MRFSIIKHKGRLKRFSDDLFINKHSNISTNNIHIEKDSDGTQTQTAYTAIRTETAQANTGRLKNLFDREKIETAVRQQREVGQEFGKNAPQAIAAVSDKLGDTRNYERHQIAKTLLEAELQNAGTEAEKAAVREKLSQVNTYLTENQNRYHTWKEGGAGRSILHGAAGGLATGNLSGVLAGSGTSFAAPYLDKVSDDLGNTGKALINTLGGAAVGLAAGGNIGGAAVGANTDWNNRQLHDSELKKIQENAAKFAKLHPGITRQQAEERLMAQAMRQVDAAYHAKHADNDTAAEQFLRSIAGSFKADGETFLDFAPMKHYRDSDKFAEQTGYREQRTKLEQNPPHTEAQRSRTIQENTYGTIGSGVKKGIANTIARNIQAAPPHYVSGKTDYTNWGKDLVPYDNAVERAIGGQAGDMVEKAVAAVSLGRSLPSKIGVASKNIAKLAEVNIGTRIDKQVTIVNKQSLPEIVAMNFKNSHYQTVLTKEPVTVYRKFGGGSRQAKLLGGYTTTISNAGRNETAVYKKWSTSQFEAEIEIPKNQMINIGKVGQQPPNSLNPKYRGGEDQILMPRNYPIEWVRSVKDGKTGRVYTLEEFVRKFPDQVK